MSKFNFYTNGDNLVVCTTKYHGKIIRGTAKKHPHDTFNELIGEGYAQARCERKLAKAKRAYLEHRMDCLMEEQKFMDTQREKLVSLLIENNCKEDNAISQIDRLNRQTHTIVK